MGPQEFITLFCLYKKLKHFIMTKNIGGPAEGSLFCGGEGVCVPMAT